MAIRQSRKAPSAEVLERERLCLELRRAGMTFDAIGKQVGFAGGSPAKRAYERALARTLQPAAAEARKEEMDRLDRLWFEAYSVATASQDRYAPDPERPGQRMRIPAMPVPVRLEAVRACVRVSERRSRLLGLDAPVRVDHRVTDSITAEIQTLADQLEAQALREAAP